MKIKNNQNIKPINYNFQLYIHIKNIMTVCCTPKTKNKTKNPLKE